MTQFYKPNPKALQSKIKHIVVLMLENRSFDNLLGWLYMGQKMPAHKSFQQSFEGLNLDLWNPLNNIDSEGNAFIEKVPIAQNGQSIVRSGKVVPNPVDFSLPNPDPGEVYRDINYQLFQKYQVGALYPPQPVNMGFVQDYHNAMLYGTYVYHDKPADPREIMTCYTPEQTPVLSGLATNFAVCDHYHASVPSQTLPNRSFVHAGTSGGNVNNEPNPFCNARTIFNQIQEAIDAGREDLSWGIYGNNISSGKEDDSTGVFGKDHFSLTRLAMTQLHDARYNNNFGTLKKFYDACKKGKIPSYSFLEPTLGGLHQNDQHPPSDIRAGENLIAEVYNAVKQSPACKETLLIITYDEHGGCYDHVAPPKAICPEPGCPPGQEGFLFNRFGIRVPCVLINPYIPKGLIARPEGSTPFDHTSIIKTIQNCFGLSPHLTERSNAAPDFSCVLQRESPRQHDELPEVLPHKLQKELQKPHVNNLHRLMARMVEKLTGESLPDEDIILEFIQKNYSSHFGKEQK